MPSSSSPRARRCIFFYVFLRVYSTAALQWATDGTEGSLLVLAYDTNVSNALLEDFYQEQAVAAGVEMRLLGQGTRFEGFGSKHALALAELEKVAPGRLVVLSDYDDVVLNWGAGAARDFQARFEEIRGGRKGAVVMSGETLCCVGAMSFFRPGEKISASGQRTGRACFSGKEGCVWNAGGQYPWIDFMTSLQRERGYATNRSFLNAGLIAGRAGDLARVIRLADIGNGEDDQAVFSELMFRRPDLVLLDYEQSLFGLADWPKGYPEGCAFDWLTDENIWRHREAGTKPLFLHCPGKFYRCFTELAHRLAPDDPRVATQARRNWATQPGDGGFR